MYTLEIPAKRAIPFESDALYSSRAPRREEITLRMIPYHAFANRGESDMRVWMYLG
jgi:DUF1680 family protein